VKRTVPARKQTASDSLSNQFSMEEEDLELAAAPGSRRVDVDD
jgi:hypothetical protein